MLHQVPVLPVWQDVNAVQRNLIETLFDVYFYQIFWAINKINNFLTRTETKLTTL